MSNAVRAVRVTHGNETIETNDAHNEQHGKANWEVACDELIQRHGPGVPVVEVRGDVQSLPAVEPAPASSPAPIKGGQHDAQGEARSQADHDAAVDAGFAPAQPLYQRGTRVIQWGVENARTSRLEHDAKPLVGEMCDEFVQRIRSEQRRDIDVRAVGLNMAKTGELLLPGPTPRRRVDLTQHALRGLVTRLGIGGARYLSDCWPELRAINVNHWTTKLAADEERARDIENERAVAEDRDSRWSPQMFALRVRNNPKRTNPEVFGVVSPRYQAFDVDKIAEAIKLATPDGARGTVAYDGFKARFEVMFHSDVKPEHYVAGEFFKAGVIVRTDDTGGGSISPSAAVWQNLCLNLIIIDRAVQFTPRIRHMGSVEDLAARFRASFTEALSKIDHFVRLWGYACDENIIETSQATTNEKLPVKIEEAIPGFFNGILERELVPIRGRRQNIVPQLVQMWERDDSAAAGATRGAIVNAFTRYAHEVNRDPFAEDEIQEAAGALLTGRRAGSRPDPLPWLAVD